MTLYWSLCSGISSRDFALDCIKRYIGQSGDIDIVTDKGEYGKPYIKSLSVGGADWGGRVYYNLSHSGELIVCVVAGHEVGVDCQETVRAASNIKGISERFFSREENAYLSSKISDYNDAFFEIWTRKEAYIKYTGKGISEGLQSFSVVRDGAFVANVAHGVIYPVALDKIEGYKCAVCFSGKMSGEDINIIRLHR